MSFLSKLFGGGGGSGPKVQTEDYKGFTITPAPERGDGGYRLGALIVKDDKSHTLIRADMFNDLETATAACIVKAKLVIDQQGDSIFR